MDVTLAQENLVRENDSQDYPALFRRQIANGLHALLAAARTDPDEELTERALTLLDFGLKLAETWPQTRDLLVALGSKAEQRGRWSEWLAHLRTGIGMAQALEDDRAYAELSLWTGVLVRAMGDYADARRWLAISEERFAALDDPYRVVDARNRLAWNERLAGNLDQAQALAEDALRRLGHQAHDEDAQRARSHSILGAVAYDRGEWAAAEEHFHRALQTPGLAKDRSRLAWAHADLASTLSFQGKHEDALSEYQAAIEVLGCDQAPVQKAGIQMNLAGLYVRSRKPAEALVLCGQVSEAFRRVQDERRLIMVEINWGIACRQLCRHDEAEQVLVSAIQRAEKILAHVLQANALDELGQVYINGFRRQEAIDAFQASLQCLDQAQHFPKYDYYQKEIHLHLRQARALPADKIPQETTGQ